MTEQAKITKPYKIYVQGELKQYKPDEFVSGWVAQKALEDGAAEPVEKRKTAAPENKAMEAPETKTRKPRRVRKTKAAKGE